MSQSKGFKLAVWQPVAVTSKSGRSDYNIKLTCWIINAAGEFSKPLDLLENFDLLIFRFISIPPISLQELVLPSDDKRVAPTRHFLLLNLI